MTILWCGGEDVDFPNGTAPGVASGGLRAYSRCSVFGGSNTSPSKSTVFPNGEITSGWLSCFMQSGYLETNKRDIGLCNSGTTNNGLFIGNGSSTREKLTLWKLEGTTFTELAAESGASIPGYGNQAKYDIQVIDYGTNGTVNVYISGSLVLSFTGDISISGVDGFDCVGMLRGNPAYYMFVSEIIVAAEDTRNMVLLTNYPESAGDSNSWTGVYTSVDEITLDTADKISSSTDSADFQANLTGMPAGIWAVKAVKVYAHTVDTTATMGVQLGVKTNSTVNVGTTQACTSTWETKERLMELNPVTGLAWTPAEIDALQLNIRAKVL